ncbi:helix-turn-helix domain-containing protein [Streptomyces sp. NBC_01497]|uniref:helix-turn-helix domain-containing protein n=1 Tax=Streptomyces sp. NBC_01497 TaxID=2903885 RepID=UPI002E36C0DA|nr:helix-turn-helix transcriptional regulator [Streptomyces sp. NBC_01497]
MSRELDYRWHLRELLATRCSLFATTDLIPLLAERGVVLSASQTYRLVTERPERLSLRTLMALLDILGCSMEELIEPVVVQGRARKAAGEQGGPGRAGGGGAGQQASQSLDGLRPRRARVIKEQ